MTRTALLFCLILAAAPALRGGFLNHTEARFARVQDPLQDAMEAAADGRLEEALTALKDLASSTPGDAEAWACLAAVAESAGRKADRREALAALKDREPDVWKALLDGRRRQLKERTAEVLAEKEAKGLIPLAVVTPRPTPDKGVWERVERERRPTPSPTPALAPARDLSIGPRIKGMDKAPASKR